jgi:hypothetical protein
LRLAAWKTALRVRLSPELQQQTFEIGSNEKSRKIKLQTSLYLLKNKKKTLSFKIYMLIND